ncbi:TetR/AcrR family transcriptional regulator [Paenibacillus sp. ACRRX]|uniref:TetR/AcrR family transcriptional regulator n=1 Tax=unclassified Paenibacillus TaxID=185978 RepID=UPI001EF74246|nr:MULTISPECIES: TetR/AcrR family transcriptional regulator [unclassified Paenibacillus]MCG7408520.1 TetR/AcrR family transcriptional regulator [Paenibacillus sp. ACRRX]MDK8182768.1 TetR/AcrR family transcriptional regulator [Paenibacillus sp. UMB4589-SE434]
MRERIMQAFVDEILDKGMKFTMDDLAHRLGISKRTLYEHFPSKVEVLDSIVEQALHESEVRAREIVQDHSLTVLDKIRAVMTVLPNNFELVDNRILDQMKRLFPAQWEKIDGMLKDDWAMLRELIEEGMEQGVIRKQNVAFLMKLITDAVNSTLDQRFFAKQNISLPDAMNAIADVILFGLVPRESQVQALGRE